MRTLTVTVAGLLLAGCTSGPSEDVQASNDRIEAYQQVAVVRLANMRPKQRDALCWGYTNDYPVAELAKLVAPPVGDITPAESETVTVIVLSVACRGDGTYDG